MRFLFTEAQASLFAGPAPRRACVPLYSPTHALAKAQQLCEQWKVEAVHIESEDGLFRFTEFALAPRTPLCDKSIPAREPDSRNDPRQRKLRWR